MLRYRRLPLHLRLLLALLIILLAPAGLPAAAGYAQEPEPGYALRECEDTDERALRDELNAISQAIFTGGQTQLDVAALVEYHWLQMEIDKTIDSEIETAVANLYQNEGYWSRFLSGWSSDKAREFTQQIANEAFGSEAFHAKIESLSTSVADAIAAEMTVISARSASSALLCVQAFVGTSYSDTMAALFEAEIQEQVGEIDLADVDANVMPLLESHTRSLAGIGVILGSQIAKRLAQEISKRIAGKVVGRIVGKAAAAVIPVAGWIIGGGLIVWDLIEGGRGALPQIQAALQEENIKAGIRNEVTITIEEELRKELPEVARTVANDVYSSWLDFQRKYTQVLALADENDQFRSLIDNVTTAEVGKLATLLVTLEEAVGREGVEQALAQGTLEQILYLPQEAHEILRTTANPALVLAWADLAGADLAQVVALEVYKLATPETFRERADLSRLLALQDKETISELLLLNQLERDVLLALPQESLVSLAAIFAAEDLRWLATYIAQLAAPESNLLVERLLRDPGLMDKLQYEPVRQAVVQSANVDETLAFLSTDANAIQQSPVEQMGRVLEDAERLIGGEVTFLLFWRKYGTLRNLLIVLGILGVLVVGMRLLWRRNQPVHVTVNIPESRRS